MGAGGWEEPGLKDAPRRGYRYPFSQNRRGSALRNGTGERTDKLKALKTLLIAFEDFRSAYPDGLVLSRDTGFFRKYGRNPYRGYEFGDGPIMPAPEMTKTGLRPMDKLVVLRDGERYKAHTMKSLERAGVTHDKIGGEPVVIFFARSGLSPVDHTEMSQSREVGAVGVFRAEADGRRRKRTRG